MITMPEIIRDLFSFLDKDQIERIQLVNQFWNNVAICHKNILPLRLFARLDFNSYRVYLYATEEDFPRRKSYQIKFNGTNLSKVKENVSSRYSQLTVDDVLNNLNNVVFNTIKILYYDPDDRRGNLFNFMKLTTKTGGRLQGRFGKCFARRCDSKLAEIFDNYIIVNELALGPSKDSNISEVFLDNYITFDALALGFSDSYIRKVCANPEIVQLPSAPKEIRFRHLEFKENDEVLNFSCNGKLNRANRVTIEFDTSDTNYGNFIRQWFELYRTHQNPISLVGKFELITYTNKVDSVLDVVKTFFNNTQLRVKYSLETKEFYNTFYGITNQYVKRRCVLLETDSYALVIEMAYGEVADMSSINASDLDQPPCNQMRTISFCVKSL